MWLSVYGKMQLPSAFFKKVVLKNFAKLTAKHLCWSPLLTKLWAQAIALLKKRFFYFSFFCRITPVAASLYVDICVLCMDKGLSYLVCVNECL